MSNWIQTQQLLVNHKSVEKLAQDLGNPALHLVEKPSDDIKTQIREWIAEGCSIPSTTNTMIIKRCYFSAQKASHSDNVLEVCLLESGGQPLKGHEQCYFQVFKVSAWLHIHCKPRQRKKHVWNALGAAQPQSLYDCSP